MSSENFSQVYHNDADANRQCAQLNTEKTIFLQVIALPARTVLWELFNCVYGDLVSSFADHSDCKALWRPVIAG